MPLIQDLAKLSLQEKGLEGFSFTMPVAATKWVDDGSSTPSVTYDAAGLSLQCASHNWLAPFSGNVIRIDASASPLPVTLQKADGSVVNEAGLLLRLFPQAILRIRRLLALKAEPDGPSAPLKSEGIAVRQVPAWIFFSSTSGSSPATGLKRAGEDLGVSGTISFFDEQGYILHPLYVASVAKMLTGLYPALNADESHPDHLSHFTGLQSGSKMVRLVKPGGLPHNGDKVEGVTISDATSGLFSINAPGGSDTSVLGVVKRQDDTAATGAFPPQRARQILLANVCYGRHLDSITLPAQVSSLGSNSLVHDFFTIEVLDLADYLTGTPEPALPATQLEPRPQVRLNENVRLLSTGNEILGSLSAVFSGSPAESLLVAPKMDEQMLLPADSGNVTWPAFPALPGGFTAEPEDVPFPANLREELETHSRADFIQPQGGGQPVDVLLRLTGLPRGAAVRVFTRQFGNDAVVKRGDGAGGVCTQEVAPVSGRTLNGELVLVLRDPLGLVRPDGTVTVPSDPLLIVDIMVVRQNKKQKRLYGAVTFPVQVPAVASPAALAPNILAGVSKRGVSRAAILGLHDSATTSFDFSSFENTLNSILAYMGETQPRDAARHPTMARRDLTAASRKTSGWEAVLGAGRIDGRMHHDEQDMGSPGSPGGPESVTAGIYTQQGQLAWDIGRAAFRRTTSIYERMVPLSDAGWNEPSIRSPLGAADPPTADQGLFAGAVLQNIAPYCETPELGLLKTLVTNNISSIPATFDDLVDLVVTWINGINTSGLPSPLDAAANRLRTELVTKLNDLKDDNALSESDKERLYNELKRELSSSCFGRRDTQWALKQAIQQARHFIYLETPGFSITQGIDSSDHQVDLNQLLLSRLQAVPGLRLIICVPKKPDYQPAYAQWIAKEVKSRYDLLQGFPDKQVVVFHPVGFPGRSSNIEHHTVIVDDRWALTGSSAWRRRGMGFDGSTDLVFTETELRHGKSESISALRRSLMARRLGISPDDQSGSRALQLHHIPSAFTMIRQMLQAGGLGKVERLWNGREPGITWSDPTLPEEVANPDGQRFNSLQASVFAAFASLPK